MFSMFVNVLTIPNILSSAFDEKPVALISDGRERVMPEGPGEILKKDYEYVRGGSANVFCAVEPKVGRYFNTVTDRRAGCDFAEFLQSIEAKYSDAKKIVLVMDNLSTHKEKHLIECFGEKEGRRLWARFEPHYTPKHASWLNQAEIALVCTLASALVMEESATSRISKFKRRRGIKEQIVKPQSSTGASRNQRRGKASTIIPTIIGKNLLDGVLVKTDLALHLDETPWKIQNKKEQDGYMWVISNRYGSYYFFKPTRSGQVLKEKLGDYSGPALTDGFGGYNVLEDMGIKQGFCWAHARREFIPLESHDPTVKPILDLIDKLFEYEREATSFTELGRIRDEKSRKVIEDLHALLMAEHPRSRPGSQKRMAIEYSLKRWTGLTFFLDDLKLPISNNEAERTIRHAVMGRKNYYGSGNHEGANTAATLFTIIESAKKNDLDPRTFLIMSLDRAACGEELETPLAYARRTRQPA